MEMIGDCMWQAVGTRPGRDVCITFGTHGNEQSPIDAGLALVDSLISGERILAAGSLLLVHANWKATEEGTRWSTGGVDLNRCFHPADIAKDPARFEQERAREIAAALEVFDPSVVVDFHCTVEPGERFAMQHPSVADAAHREVTRLLTTGVILGDPSLTFGGVSIDEWASTRGKVGICYETGWLGDPLNTSESVLAEMENVLVGVGLIDGEAKTYDEKRLLELDGRIDCAGDSFRWNEGVQLPMHVQDADLQTSGRAAA